MTTRMFLIGLSLMAAANAGSETISLDPIEFQKGEFQYFLDDYLIENRYDQKFLVTVRHFVHPGKEESANPVLKADKPWETHGLIGPASVIYDAESKLFRAYYYLYRTSDKTVPSRTAYAESADGVHWIKPTLDYVLWEGEKTNVILSEDHGIFQIADVPQEKRGDHRLLGYCTKAAGGYLAGSQDGIQWKILERIIPSRSDCQHSITYDPKRDEFLSYFRNVLHFKQVADHLKSGTTRVISRIFSPQLFTLWDLRPAAVILPEEDDASLFYGMTVAIKEGVYFGLLEQFELYPHETIDIDLCTSRDGLAWKRYGKAARLVHRGPYGSWNGGMVKPAGLVDYGDEWLLYYIGYEGYHGEVLQKKSSLGLLRFRKEGFVSVRSHEARKSYVITRPLIWPGGELQVNFDGVDVFPESGALKVRVVNADREPIEGFSYEECEVFEGDAVRAPIRWKNADIASLKDREIRLEFEFQHGDLFGFIAK